MYMVACSGILETNSRNEYNKGIGAKHKSMWGISLEEQMAIVEVSSRVLNTYVVDSIVVCEAYHRLLIVGL